MSLRHPHPGLLTDLLRLLLPHLKLSASKFWFFSMLFYNLFILNMRVGNYISIEYVTAGFMIPTFIVWSCLYNERITLKRFYLFTVYHLFSFYTFLLITQRNDLKLTVYFYLLNQVQKGIERRQYSSTESMYSDSRSRTNRSPEKSLTS